MFARILENQLKSQFFKGKSLILAGARQTGKTTLALNLIKKFGPQKKSRYFNCDDPDDREALSGKNLEFLKKLTEGYDIIFIDEGQKVETIGQTIKLLADHYKKKKQIVITGSSSIHLLDKTQEALTGRKFVYNLFPLSLAEIYPDKDLLKISKEIENLLVFGSYPEVVTKRSFDQKITLLHELSGSSLYKDIFEFQQVKNPDLLRALLKALALQIGSEVSFNELSNLLGIDKKTIERYVDLLEKNFIIFRLPPYTKKTRREIAKLRKIFFYDLGIRNSVINNFNFLNDRNDAGALFENFMVLERLKYRTYNKIYANQYFWRTYDGSEVDLIEERNGRLYGYEFKWKGRPKNSRAPASWLKYPSSTYQLISPQDLSGFVL